MNIADVFRGIAVVVDDEIGTTGSTIDTICAGISETGVLVMPFKTLPADPSHFGGVAFFILDWDLSGLPAGSGVGTSTLRGKHTDHLTAFIKGLQKIRHAPVFVFTEEGVDEVVAALEKDPELGFSSKGPSHILVRSKSDIRSAGVQKTLEDWFAGTPSALVLRRWELDYERAKNSFFLDFYSKSVHWPTFLWKTYQDDGIDPSDELGRLISRNLESRMEPFQFDLSALVPKLDELRESDPGGYRSALTKVLSGERFIEEKYLSKESVAPGDVFKGTKKEYYVNIRPDCDCISRNGSDVTLYLLKGDKVSTGQLKFDDRYGNVSESDNQAIVFSIQEGVSLAFSFKELDQKNWSELKDKRIGRLLPPYSTRVQQRYAAYLQRPGIPRVPVDARPPQPQPPPPTKPNTPRRLAPTEPPSEIE